MRAPLGSAAWADELGARVTWMVDRGEQVASLRLSPENLGPVEVRIAMREGETSVWFGAAHADTRAAIEQSRRVWRSQTALTSTGQERGRRSNSTRCVSRLRTCTSWDSNGCSIGSSPAPANRSPSTVIQ